MAYALGWHIIPVQIEPFGKYTSKQLPMWAAKLQLHTLFEGSADYDDKFQELKQLLGTPLPIRQYIEEMLVHFQNSHVLLDDVGLALVERHYHELHLPKDKKELADKLIRESRRKKLDYLKRYDALQDDYEQEQQENDRLKKKIEKMGTDRIIDVGAFTVLTIIILSFLLYLFLLLKGVL